jgi:F0F1-type ATP synthase assembly protein I
VSEPEESSKRTWVVQVARYSQLAFTLPAATAIGWFVGLVLDHWLHTTWLYLAGIVVGIIAGFVDLIRTVMADSK